MSGPTRPPPAELAREARWVAEPPPDEVEAQLLKLRKTDDVCHVAVMPDVHLGSDACVGSVIATERLLYPSAVGGDLGCGMAALRFGCAAELLADRARAARVLAALGRRVPAATRPRAQLDELGGLLGEPLRELEASPLSTPALESFWRRTGRAQLGTLGGGNHFIELQADEEGWLWMMLHSGSRGIGQAILESHVARAPRGATGLPFLEAQSAAGRAYLDDLGWGLRYAEANRLVLARAAAELVEDVLQTQRVESSYVACHHNYIRREEHGEHGPRALWVHRKGAISARAGELGIIPGSMGTPSYHVEGRGHTESLCSSSHGAGRCMSRGEARREISVRKLEAEMKAVWFDRRNAERLRDEAPSAYKDIGGVMRAQRELTRIVRRLHPVLSYKGS